MDNAKTSLYQSFVVVSHSNKDKVSGERVKNHSQLSNQRKKCAFLPIEPLQLTDDYAFKAVYKYGSFLFQYKIGGSTCEIYDDTWII